MRTLYQFPFSPYCEKARWLLDYKELAFEAKNRLPFIHRGFSYFHTQQFKLPILFDQNQYIADSCQIARYLEQYYPEYPLFFHQQTPRELQFNQQIEQIEQHTQALGQIVKHWLYATALAPEYQHAIQIMIGERGLLRRFERISLPLLRRTLQAYYRVDVDKMSPIEHQLLRYFMILQQQLEYSDSGYLVGERLSLADIGCCSMLAPIVMPMGTPWQGIQTKDEQQPIYHTLRQSGLAEYVTRIYTQHRHARVDWRGV